MNDIIKVPLLEQPNANANSNTSTRGQSKNIATWPKAVASSLDMDAFKALKNTFRTHTHTHTRTHTHTASNNSHLQQLPHSSLRVSPEQLQDLVKKTVDELSLAFAEPLQQVHNLLLKSFTSSYNNNGKAVTSIADFETKALLIVVDVLLLSLEESIKDFLLVDGDKDVNNENANAKAMTNGKRSEKEEDEEEDDDNDIRVSILASKVEGRIQQLNMYFEAKADSTQVNHSKSFLRHSAVAAASELKALYSLYIALSTLQQALKVKLLSSQPQQQT